MPASILRSDRARILVTGARGYLGGRLVLHLVEKGFDVSGTTRGEAPLPSGWPADVPLLRLDPCDDPLRSRAALEGVDTVVHLAAANELRSASDPEAAVYETGGGTRRLLEAAIQARVRRFVFMSTIHVYGSPLAGRLDESTTPRPTHPYAISHMVGENYVFAAHAAGRIEGVSVRLSNGIGAPAWLDVDRWSLVGNDFARQASETGKIVIKTPGQWRDFISLADVCSGIDIVLAAPREALGTGVFNLGGDMPLRILDVARRTSVAAEAILGRSIVLETRTEALPSGEVQFTVPIDAMRGLGFFPSGLAGLDRELLATFRLLKARMGTGLN